MLSQYSALGVAVAQTLHDEMYGVPDAATRARASQYFHFTPSPWSLFKNLQDKCFKRRQIRMAKGKDLISPLRHVASRDLHPSGHCWAIDSVYKSQTGHRQGQKRTQENTNQAVDHHCPRLLHVKSSNSNIGGQDNGLRNVSIAWDLGNSRLAHKNNQYRPRK